MRMKLATASMASQLRMNAFIGTDQSYDGTSAADEQNGT